jgi:hypothetical protein
MAYDKATIAAIAAKAAALRKEADELEKEQSTLNEYAPGDEGNRHAFLGIEIRGLRERAVKMIEPVLDALEDDLKN